MGKRRLSAVRLNTDHVGGLTLDDCAFDDLLDALDILPGVQRYDMVRSEKPGEGSDESREYIVRTHELPGPDAELITVYSCTCGDFQWNRAPKKNEIDDNPPAGLAAIEPCKHGDVVRRRDRTVEARADDQQGIDAYAPDGTDAEGH